MDMRVVMEFPSWQVCKLDDTQIGVPWCPHLAQVSRSGQFSSTD